MGSTPLRLAAMTDDDTDTAFAFAPETVMADDNAAMVPWVVLIVDDEPQVHDVTELVMADFAFGGRHLMFLHAYSAAEAREILVQRDDIALVLLDVVMETETAGLDLARDIREVLLNHRTRIVLRTGQPGQAPEETVIKNYDINDYKEKTELTKRKLVTVFYSALRGYRDILAIEASRHALRRSIEAIHRIHDAGSIQPFASAVLEQVCQLLGLEGGGLCANRVNCWAASQVEGRVHVLAATADYLGLLDAERLAELPAGVQAAFDRAESERTSQFDGMNFVGYYRTGRGSVSLLYMALKQPMSNDARELLEIFCANVAITYESLLLRQELQETQRETVLLISEAVERRSQEGGAHVRRIAELSALLGRAWGLDDTEVERLRQASPLHDLGKLGIPDAILSKPGKLDTEEWAVMQRHVEIGHELLARSERAILRLGAQIALEHHERWDGGGYPQGLSGEQISIAGRIVALADVLDTLVSDRVYKQRWDFETAIDYVVSQSGLHFDPRLVTLLENRIDAVRDLYTAFPDTGYSMPSQLG
jgi:response regulator RpfG family c-di-GMP phosphodiesterase